MDSADMAEKKSAHVLLVALAAQGQLNPLLSFGKLLLSKGLRVTLAAAGASRDKLLAVNKPTGEAEIQFEFFSDGVEKYADSLKYTDADGYMENLEKVGRRNLSELLTTLANDGRLVSCIVTVPFIPWVIDVAEDHEIPCAMLWIQPCSVYAVYCRYCLGLNHFPDLTEPGVTLDLPGLPLLTKEDIPSFLLPSNTIKCMAKILSDMFQNMKKVRWLLVNSFYDLERTVIESMTELQTIKPVGPLVPPGLLGKEETGDDVSADMWKAAEGCVDWLNTKAPRSVVYVSFGSILVLSSKQMENLAWGLRNSGRPFLWVVKPPGTGLGEGGELPDGFLEEIAGQGLVVTWCSQAKVLSHDSIACFLTHCGWNSSLETIAAGVPVVAFPQWTDQPTCAKLLVDVLQMGLRLRKEEEDGVVTKDEVERCIIEITEGQKSEQLKKAALEWKKAAEAAAMEGGSSDRNIQVFVDQIVGGGSDEK